MPYGIPLPVDFNKYWRKENDRFHSVDEVGMQKEYEKRNKQLEELIRAKNIEISVAKQQEEEFLGNQVEPMEDDLNDQKEQWQIDQEMQWEEKKQALEKELEQLKECQKKLKEKFEQYMPTSRAVSRRKATEKRFFEPSYSNKKKELIALTNELIDQRFNSSKANLPMINLQGKSTHLLITAEKAFQEAVIALNGENIPCLSIIPTMRKRPWTVNRSSSYERSGTTGYGPVEKYQVDNTTIESEHRTSPKRARSGDSFLSQLKSYDDSFSPQLKSHDEGIYSFLFRLTDGKVENEKQLAVYMIRYGKTQQGVSLSDLQKISEKAVNNDVDRFNQICFLVMAKEQAQWQTTTDKSFMGLVVAQARGLIMVEAGYISFKEIFKNDVLFSIYSKTTLIDKPAEIEETCKYIDKAYTKYLEYKHYKEHFVFLKQQINENPRTWIPTRKQIRKDLQDVHGGENESDGEGYETDLSL